VAGCGLGALDEQTMARIPSTRSTPALISL